MAAIAAIALRKVASTTLSVICFALCFHIPVYSMYVCITLENSAEWIYIPLRRAVRQERIP